MFSHSLVNVVSVTSLQLEEIAFLSFQLAKGEMDFLSCFFCKRYLFVVCLKSSETCNLECIRFDFFERTPPETNIQIFKYLLNILQIFEGTPPETNYRESFLLDIGK